MINEYNCHYDCAYYITGIITELKYKVIINVSGHM